MTINIWVGRQLVRFDSALVNGDRVNFFMLDLIILYIVEVVSVSSFGVLQ